MIPHSFDSGSELLNMWSSNVADVWVIQFALKFSFNLEKIWKSAFSLPKNFKKIRNNFYMSINR